MSNDAALRIAIEGRHGRSTPTRGDREHIDGHTFNVILEAVRSSGARHGPAQVYVAKRMRYHLGKESAPPCPNELRGLEEWAQRRAFDLVVELERRLPARVHERDL